MKNMQYSYIFSYFDTILRAPQEGYVIIDLPRIFVFYSHAGY